MKDKIFVNTEEKKKLHENVYRYLMMAARPTAAKAALPIAT